MIELTLPPRPRRAQLRAFSLATALVAALVSAVLASLLDLPVPWLLGAALGVAVAGFGVVAPGSLASAYRRWNRLAAGFAQRGQRYVLRVCYYAILVPVGAMGSRMKIGTSDLAGSAWESRRSLGAGAYRSEHSASERTESGWLSGLASWSTSRGDPWVWALVPFLALLRALSSSRAEHMPENIYTLY